MFGGGNFRNLIHACESDCRAARGSRGKDAMREKKDAAAQYCEAVKATSELELSQAHSAPRGTNSCVTLCCASISLQTPRLECLRWEVAQERLRCWKTALAPYWILISISYTSCIFFFFASFFKINTTWERLLILISRNVFACKFSVQVYNVCLWKSPIFYFISRKWFPSLKRFSVFPQIWWYKNLFSVALCLTPN